MSEEPGRSMSAVPATNGGPTPGVEGDLRASRQAAVDTEIMRDNDVCERASKYIREYY